MAPRLSIRAMPHGNRSQGRGALQTAGFILAAVSIAAVQGFRRRHQPVTWVRTSVAGKRDQVLLTALDWIEGSTPPQLSNADLVAEVLLGVLFAGGQKSDQRDQEPVRSL